MTNQNQNDANITEEEIETEYNDSEFEGGERRSIAFTINSSIPTLNPLDSSSDDYRFASGEHFVFFVLYSPILMITVSVINFQLKVM